MFKDNIKLVSVIIPCYNDGKFIEEAVRSVINQTYPHKEIIVVDDGSNPSTKSYLKKIKLIIDKLIIQENLGVCHARNNGIDAATGEYIVTLDADDYFEPDFIMKAIDILDRNSTIGLVSCYARLIKDGHVYKVQKPKGTGLDRIVFENNAYGCLMFRKQCWRDVGGYDINMRKGYEDWEFNISVLKAGWGLYVLKEPLLNYRNKPNSRNKSISIQDNIDLVKYIYRKHSDIYIENYDTMVEVIFDKLKQARIQETNIKNSYDYRLGSILIFPFRIIKSFFHSKK
ncbi:glycosyltransferase family 2 protein [Salegentibacter sp. UBA1130]|uniref:glycosyltransferase family 2 protein n=1 Tax=Salegentibacter sp. UBA1130 TaxID=1947451 RepID=UPI00257A3DDF|nr:glycosyltransferase family A protein [Salegentibacter sp. UBA1130]